MIEKSVDKRWEDGVSHHPKSKELFEALAKIDMDNGDSFCWKSGGDGDNGETLMYELDIYFEHIDAGIPYTSTNG